MALPVKRGDLVIFSTVKDGKSAAGYTDHVGHTMSRLISLSAPSPRLAPFRAAGPTSTYPENERQAQNEQTPWSMLKFCSGVGSTNAFSAYFFDRSK